MLPGVPTSRAISDVEPASPTFLKVIGLLPLSVSHCPRPRQSPKRACQRSNHWWARQVHRPRRQCSMSARPVRVSQAVTVSRRALWTASAEGSEYGSSLREHPAPTPVPFLSDCFAVCSTANGGRLTTSLHAVLAGLGSVRLSIAEEALRAASAVCQRHVGAYRRGGSSSRQSLEAAGISLNA